MPGKKRPRYSPSKSLVPLRSAARGARLSKNLAAFRRMRRITRAMGRNRIHQFNRTLYSNIQLSTGDPLQNIYVQMDAHNPFRVLNGSGSYVNCNNYSITFQPSQMVINWFQDGTNVATYSYIVPEFSELTRLFDQMQINYVEIEWYYSGVSVTNQEITMSGGGGGPTRPVVGQPMHLYVKDYDDANGMKFTEFVQFENQKSWQMGTGYLDSRHRLRIKPKMCFNASDSEGTNTGVVVPQNTRQFWLDTEKGVNVDHYGIKGTLNNVSTFQETDPADTHVLGVLGFRATYHYKFKNVK